MKPCTLKELDLWLFRGLGGVVTIIQQRLELRHPPTTETFALVEHQLERLANLVAEHGQRCTMAYPDQSAGTEQFDTWLVRGFNAILQMLEERRNAGPLNLMNDKAVQAMIVRLHDQIIDE